CSCMLFPPTPAAVALVVRYRVLKRLQILQRERTGFEQIGNEETRRPAEQLQQVSDQPAPVLALIDRRLEDLRIADLFHLAHGTFLLEPVNQCLNRRVSDPLILGETVENLTDGAFPQLPDLLEDPCFGFRKAHFYFRSTTLYVDPTTTAVFVHSPRPCGGERG